MTIEERVEELVSKLTLREKVSLLSGADVLEHRPHRAAGHPRHRHDRRPARRARQPATAARIAGPGHLLSPPASRWPPPGTRTSSSASARRWAKRRAAWAATSCSARASTSCAPRWPGATSRAYSEDPYLAGRIGVAWVKGVQSRGVGASLKHYACNNQEIERFRGSSEVDERTLREIYLPAVRDDRQRSPALDGDVLVQPHQRRLRQPERLPAERDPAGTNGASRASVVSDWGANHTIVRVGRGRAGPRNARPGEILRQPAGEAVRHTGRLTRPPSTTPRAASCA